MVTSEEGGRREGKERGRIGGGHGGEGERGSHKIFKNKGERLEVYCERKSVKVVESILYMFLYWCLNLWVKERSICYFCSVVTNNHVTC